MDIGVCVGKVWDVNAACHLFEKYNSYLISKSNTWKQSSNEAVCVSFPLQNSI